MQLASNAIAGKIFLTPKVQGKQTIPLMESVVLVGRRLFLISTQRKSELTNSLSAQSNHQSLAKVGREMLPFSVLSELSSRVGNYFHLLNKKIT